MAGFDNGFPLRYNGIVSHIGLHNTMDKDKSYRFRLPNELFEAAQAKASREDLSLAQVLRRFLREWVKGNPPEEPEQEKD